MKLWVLATLGVEMNQTQEAEESSIHHTGQFQQLDLEPASAFSKVQAVIRSFNLQGL